MIRQFFYKIIYLDRLNYILRNINFFLKPLLKNVKLPPSGIMFLKTNSGTIRIATNQTSYLTQLLFWNGYKNFEYSEIFEILSKKIDCFLDIGANIGYYSILSAKSNPNIIVYAFEPAKGPKHFLDKNIKINEFYDQITIVDMALSNKKGKIDFFEVANQKYSYLNHNLAGEGNAGTKTTSRHFIKNVVKSTTLEEFAHENLLKKIDLIKIDTEGTEIDILNSGKSIIQKHQPIVICETLYNTIEQELESFFKDLNFRIFAHMDKKLKEVQHITRTEDNGIRNCFFVPESKLHLIANFID